MAKKQKRQFYIYLGIASLLLLWPYGFYTLVRFLAMSAFAYLAYLEYKSKNMDRMLSLACWRSYSSHLRR